MAYSMSRSARASVTTNLRRLGFICAIACKTATPSLLAAINSMARAVFMVSPLAFDPPLKPSTKYAGATPSLSANWIIRLALIRLVPLSYFCTC